MSERAENILIGVVAFLVCAGVVVGIIFGVRSMPPSSYSRCASVFPDALTITADTGRAGAVECTMTLADTSEVVVWLDSDGVVLK